MLCPLYHENNDKVVDKIVMLFCLIKASISTGASFVMKQQNFLCNLLLFKLKYLLMRG